MAAEHELEERSGEGSVSSEGRDRVVEAAEVQELGEFAGDLSRHLIRNYLYEFVECSLIFRRSHKKFMAIWIWIYGYLMDPSNFVECPLSHFSENQNLEICP